MFTSLKGKRQMKQLIAIALLSLALTFSLGGAVQAKDDAASLRKDINGILDKWGHNMFEVVEKKDWKKLQTKFDEEFTSDCVQVNPDGTKLTGRKQVVADFKKWLSGMNELYRFDVKLQTARLTGPKTAQGIVAYDISWKGKDPKTSKMHRYGIQGKEQDTWVKMLSGWKCNHSVEGLDERTFTDGKQDPKKKASGGG